eukprot:IDg13925t1
MRHPRPHHAFVLSVSCPESHITKSAYEYGALIIGYHSVDVETFVAVEVDRALNTRFSCAPNHSNTLHPSPGTQLKLCLPTRKNIPSSKTQAAPKDKTIPSSTKPKRCKLVSAASALAVRRPLSASEVRAQHWRTARPNSARGAHERHRRVQHPQSGQGNTSRGDQTLNIKEMDKTPGSLFRTPSRNTLLQRPQSAAAVMVGFAKTLPSWNNPCFKYRGRAPIAAPSTRGESSRGRGVSLLDMNKLQISRDALSSLRVIAQIERKFIVCVDSEKTLYAVDQHAASERALFERLKRDTEQSQALSLSLQAPMIVALSAEQQSILFRYWRQLHRWGWQLARPGPLAI